MSNDQKVRIDLGCGKKKRAGSIGVDWSDQHDADVVHDLNVFPYPFESSIFDEIYIDNTLEHLDDVVRVMEEIHRICKPGGFVKVIVPYFRSVWACVDPTHKHFFTVESFSYYDPDHVICQRYDYTLTRFKTERIIFHEDLNRGLIKRAVVYFANKSPLRYERFLSHFIPLDEITYYLKRV